MIDSDTISQGDLSESDGPGGSPRALALVILWSSAEPHRIGEVALFPGSQEWTLGRGAAGPPTHRAEFVQQRPGSNVACPPLGGVGLSREQMRIRPRGGALEVVGLGKAPLSIDGVERGDALLQPGMNVYIRNQLILGCVIRPLRLPPLRHFPSEGARKFGEPDATGMIGESEVMWALRERVAFVAEANTHALILGESGTGKELAARALHQLSSRHAGVFVARNAATIPASLFDAEFFGNAKNYPNPGMQERAGLIGEANRGTLFLDELAELPHDLQTHILRVLDSDGEYHRLGEASSRTSSARLVGATNRLESALKHDLLARLTLRIKLPTLAERREDLPLLIQHLLLRAARSAPGIAERFMAEKDGARYAQVAPSLLMHLLRCDFPTNLREVEGALWRAMAGSSGDTIALTSELAEEAADIAVVVPAELTAARVRECLSEAKGNLEGAARKLGLKNRFALYRVMKKLGVDRSLSSDDDA